MKHNTRHWVGITAGILTLAGYASAATPGSEKYTYDASGNIIEKSIDGVATKMAYDKSNRLTEFQTAGQAKLATSYDNAGRPVTERNAAGETTRRMSYGYGDKVIETKTPDSKAGFYYNAEGQLVGKNVDGNVSTYTWDGNVLAAEGAEAFANEAHISGGVPVLASGTEVVVSDHLGNTLATGASQFRSTAYGEGLEQGRFTGKAFITELGSFVFNYRLYSPVSSRWTSPDPSGFSDGKNNLAYNCNPLIGLDPLGLTYFLVRTDQNGLKSMSRSDISDPNSHNSGYCNRVVLWSDDNYSFDLALTYYVNSEPMQQMVTTITMTHVREKIYWADNGSYSKTGTASVANRVNFEGKGTSQMDCHATCSFCVSPGTVSNMGTFDNTPNILTEHTGYGEDGAYGIAQFKVLEY